MKPQLLKVPTAPAHSFTVRRDVVPFFNNKWHYHTEIELIYFEQGSGTQFVGDNIKTFSNGDVVLVGANLPHYWRFDAPQVNDNIDEFSDVRVVHFNENFCGSGFLQMPETKLLKQLFERAKRGIQVVGRTRKQVASQIRQMLDTDSLRRLVLLIETLELIAESSEVQYLSSVGFAHILEQNENDRINAIYEYSISNYMNKITLEEISMVANVSPKSFCRYFKTQTGKTYSSFLLEYKVGMACKFLIENKLSIQQICYESGFNNFASFHKYFKKITGKTPMNYQREYLHSKSPGFGREI